MTQPIEHFAAHLSKQARRAVAALLITGSMLSSQARAADEISDTPLGSGLAATADRDASANSLDYWIFSDDYCGWASAESLVSPYAINPLAKEPVKTVAPGVRRSHGVSAADLAELAAKEPIDVMVPGAAASTSERENKPEAAKPVGAAPIIATIAEGYLPYDLSRSDQIALRMYPITIPQFNYVGGRRSAGVQRDGQGPLDCLGYGVLWSEDVLPSQSVRLSSSGQPALTAAIEEVASQATWDRWNALGNVVSEKLHATSEQTDAKRRALAIAVVEAIQPASTARQSIAPSRIGLEAGSQLALAVDAGQDVLSQAAVRIAKAKRPDRLLSAGEQLLARAGVEAEMLDCATAGVADDVAQSVCCPVEQMEIAAQPPQTQPVAAVEVAAAMLSTPQEPPAPQNSMARAEAFATACDSAAATLERWALALRRAGDSVVRVARSSNQGGSELR